MTFSDTELLDQYVTGDDQAAFEQLIRRHSTMVLGVCQSLLWQKEDAEDAFQAVFLLLSTKAPKLLKHKSLGGWLHESAFRISLKHRGKIARKREVAMQNELKDKALEPWQTISASRDTELLHFEISRLPKQYRDVIVLCHLEGKSRDQAASALEVTTQSVKASLARGRKLLRRRLLKQGVAITVALSSVQLASGSAQAAMGASIGVAVSSGSAMSSSAVSDSLIQSTMQHCQGLTPDLGIGTGVGVVQSLIAKEGTVMAWGITQASFAAAASIVTVCALSIGAIAQQTFVQGDQQGIEIGVAVDSEGLQSPVVFVQEDQDKESATDNPDAAAMQDMMRKMTGGMMGNMMGLPTDPASKDLGLGGAEKESTDEAAALKLRTLEKLFEMENELQGLKARFGQGHPSIIKLENQIARLKKKAPVSQDMKIGGAKKEATDEDTAFQFKAFERLFMAKNELQELSSRLGARHPSVVKLEKFIASLEKLLVAPSKLPSKLIMNFPDFSEKLWGETWDAYVVRLQQMNYMTKAQVEQWNAGSKVVLEPGIRVTKMREVTKIGYQPVESTRKVMKGGKLVTETFIEYVKKEIKTQEPYTVPSHGTLVLPVRGSQPDDAKTVGAVYPHNRTTYDKNKNPLPPKPKHQVEPGDLVRVKFDFEARVGKKTTGEVSSEEIYRLREMVGMRWCSVQGVKGWLPLMLVEKVELNAIDLPAEQEHDLLLQNKYVPKQLPAEGKTDKFR